MKRLALKLGITLAFALTGIGILVTHAKPAHAITVPANQGVRFGRYVECGLNVAAGAVINCTATPAGAMDTVSECWFIADNSAGGATRALTVNWLASDGTTVLYSAAQTVGIALRAMTIVSPTATTASLPTGVVVIPATVGKRMSASLAAAGSAAGSLAYYCQ